MADERKEEKAVRWNHLMFMEIEKWRSKLAAKDRKVQVEERRIALDEKKLGKEKREEVCAISFMNPNTMDAMARRY